MEENYWSNNPSLFSPGFVLNANGIDFEPELFLEKTSFDSKLIVFKGSMGIKTFEWVGEIKPRTKQIFEYKHLILKISKSVVSATQIEETISFLKKYENEILRLSKCPQVEYVVLTRKLAEGELYEELPTELTDLAFSSGVNVILH